MPLIDLALDLINEEIGELRTAIRKGFTKGLDRVEIADAIGDSIVTLLGLAYRLNIDMVPVMSAIFESNNSKFLQGVHHREDGKITKGPAFVPPKILEALQKGRHMGRISGQF